MTRTQWQAFCAFRDDFKEQCEKWGIAYNQQLKAILQKIASENGTESYQIENPIVYNTALDEISEDSVIKVILIGDNPGKNEQKNVFRRYLVGQSGKIAQSFFEKNPEFALDFRKNTIILNKTPIHSAKTAQLKLLAKDSESIAELIRETQTYMAEKTAALHIKMWRESGTELWLVGYSELKKRGVFSQYRECFKKCYEGENAAWESVFAFQHFSMNRFFIDLKAHQNDDISRPIALKNLGKAHKAALF